MPARSFAVVPREKGYRVQSAEEPWLGGVYDIFEKGGTWVIVKQNLDRDMTEALQNADKTMSLTYVDGPWEKVRLPDRIMAVFQAGGEENKLLLTYKTDDNQAVTLELVGNAVKEELVKLAEAYVGE
ncbi:hypothetical protein LJK87_41655 [Paenibacillus sp. P25]|nr:hypothetical protein LJK87_41655 [Paenibacillus sp. P25]